MIKKHESVGQAMSIIEQKEDLLRQLKEIKKDSKYVKLHLFKEFMALVEKMEQEAEKELKEILSSRIA